MSAAKENELHQFILQQVQNILFEVLDPFPVIICLFGSWARGEERRTSDIDIGIWYEDPLPTGTFSRIRTSLEESTIPFRVDLVDLTKADPVLIEKVKKEGVIWKDYKNE
jgi:uncharacterized protein